MSTRVSGATESTNARRFEGLPIGVVRLGEDLSILEANLEAARFLRCPVQEAIGRGLPELVADELLAARLRRAATDELLEPIEVRHPNAIWLVRAAQGPGGGGLAVVALECTTLMRRLSEGERNYHALFDQSAVGVAQIDSRTGRFVRVNQRYCDLVGYAVEEMLQLDFQTITHPDDLRADLGNMERLRAGALRTFQMDKRYVRKDRAQIWVRLTVVPLWNPGAAPDYHLAIVEDITARRRAEEALRYSEERWRLAAVSAGLAIWDFYPQTREVRGDEKLRELYWMTADEPFTYEALEQAISPADRGCVEAGFRRSLDPAGEGRYAVEFRLNGPDGATRDVLSSARVFFEDGRPIRVLGTLQDVTERKRAEGALRESEERFRTMVNAIPQLAWIARPEGDIYWFNQRWYEYTGTTPEQMKGWGWQSVHHPATLPMVLEKWKRSLATGEPFDMVFPLRGADGVFRPFLTRVVPFKDGKGQVIQWFGTNTDITERMQVEEELRRSRERLEEADRSKNQFLAMLSHELRNPLEPIRNCLFILDRVAPGGEQARHAQKVIDRQISHLTRLVDDLLDVTRISRGKIKLQPESLDFVDLVRRTVEDHRQEFTNSGLELALSAPEESIRIRGDRTRVAQVIGNLLTNAAKFTQRGGRVAVTVEADRGLGHAIARVRDTGPGIAPEMLSQIFEVFTQVDTTLDRSRGGLGLGLALVRGITEMHGGMASAESEGLGKGATFTVRFPLEAAVGEEAKPAGPARRSISRRRVLVIEDNVDAAETLQAVLELCGQTVDVAFSGAEGIEQARVFHPEVVFCDIGLPEMDGYSVARAMRADPALKSARLVALTGYAGPEDIDRSKKAGFDTLVAKPASLERLEDILANGA